MACERFLLEEDHISLLCASVLSMNHACVTGDTMVDTRGTRGGRRGRPRGGGRGRRGGRTTPGESEVRTPAQEEVVVEDGAEILVVQQPIPVAQQPVPVVQ